MASIMFCAGPFRGHVAPMLPIVERLVGLGHRVLVLTGRRYQDSVKSVGAVFEPLPVEVDFDENDLDSVFPVRAGLRGTRRAQFDLEHIFIEPLVPQSEMIQRILAREEVEVVVVESMFFGAIPLLLRPNHTRPRIVAWGSNPLSIPGGDRPPAGLGWQPGRTWSGRLRNELANVAIRSLALRAAQRRAEQSIRRVGADLPVSILDWLSLVDDIVQLTVPEFEFPIPDEYTRLVHFVGPLAVSDTTAHGLPDWWNDLDRSIPTVLVTQGSAETDLSHLVLPTIEALADRPINVLVSVGRELDEFDGRLPKNTYLATDLPYDVVFPTLSAFITNGGYGGVGFALRHGVPVVSVGRSQDKADVAARVEWSGIGIGIARTRVGSRRIRKAVDTVLGDSGYADRADYLHRQVRASSGMAGAVEVMLAR
ncbi:MAG: glycosyltransferase [Rhodococcus sp. (in: high G+C Gram-positive bacteria)]